MINCISKEKIWGVGRFAELPKFENITFWIEDFSGVFYPADDAIKNFRIKNNTSLHYVLSGNGYFFEDNQLKNLSKGNAFLITPFKTVKYFPDEVSPWCYCGISFDGIDVTNLMKKYGFTHPKVLNENISSEIGSIILKLLSEYKNNTLTDFKLNTYALCILSLFDNSQPNTATSNYTEQYVLNALSFLKENMSDCDLKIEDAANAVKISHSYLCKIIKNKTGKSAKSNLIEMRLSTAKHLLSTTHLPISTIAFSVGFSDLSHFCKTYKKYYGNAPGNEKRSSLT
jgi:AraC family transcriptional regulator of arabinose operon